MPAPLSDFLAQYGAVGAILSVAFAAITAVLWKLFDNQMKIIQDECKMELDAAGRREAAAGQREAAALTDMQWWRTTAWRGIESGKIAVAEADMLKLRG